MKSTTVRRTALTAAVVTALAGVAACGSQDSGKAGGGAGGSAAHASPVDALRSVEKSTDRARSARVSSTMTMGSLMTVTTDGVMSWGDGLRGDVTMKYTGGSLAAQMRRAGTSSVEARYLPDACYMKVSDAFARANGGRHWVRYAYADATGASGAARLLSQDQARNNTPNESVRLLLASHDVKKAGEEKVGGVLATHYSGTVDVAGLARGNGSLDAGQVAELKKRLDAAGITKETVDVWIDGRGRLVRKTESADSANGRMVTTATYRDYGVRADTAAPAAGDTKDLKDVLRSGGIPSGGASAGQASGGVAATS
ncbi:hypothetical protein [Streptomyces sp. NPDC005573]|uniref:hypothetical protein n=1 Tax=Streptomyces sp. NPDC005573 TaxID=3156890 RepID=UPI0033B16251